LGKKIVAQLPKNRSINERAKFFFIENFIRLKVQTKKT